MSDIALATVRLVRIDIGILQSIAALGDMVIAQNAALIEISSILNERGASSSGLESLRECLLPVKDASQEFVSTLKAALELARETGEVADDA